LSILEKCHDFDRTGNCHQRDLSGNKPVNFSLEFEYTIQFLPIITERKYHKRERERERERERDTNIVPKYIPFYLSFKKNEDKRYNDM
jgi:hypothetical protein